MLQRYDQLIRESPWIQKLCAESYAEGYAKGYAKSYKKYMRRAFLSFFNARFPTLIEFAQKKVEHVTDPEVFLQLVRQLCIVSDEETARSILDAVIS